MMAQRLLQRIKDSRVEESRYDPRRGGSRSPGGLNWMTSGGALDPILAEFDKLGIMLRQGCGMTEVGCRISVPDRAFPSSPSAGLWAACDVRIENGEDSGQDPRRYHAQLLQDAPRETARCSPRTAGSRQAISAMSPGTGSCHRQSQNLIILSSGENVSPEAIERSSKMNT